MKPWVKLYTEINRDADMGTLSWAHRGIWAALLALAGELDRRDAQDLETGELDSLDRIAWHLRIGRDELQAALEAFAERGMAEDRDGIWYLPNYGKRQEVAPSQRRPAQRDRQREHRASQVRHNPVTTLSRTVTSPEADTETETEQEADAEAEPAAAAPANNGFGKELAAHGIIINGAVQSDMWRALYEDAGLTLFREALHEAVSSNNGKPTLRYVTSIIDRCKRDGVSPGQWKDAPSRASPSPPARPAKPAPTTWRNPVSGKVESL